MLLFPIPTREFARFSASLCDAAFKCHVLVALRDAHPNATPDFLGKRCREYREYNSLALVATQLGLGAFFAERSPPSKHRLGTALEALIGHQQMQAPHEVAAVVARVMAAIDELKGGLVHFVSN